MNTGISIGVMRPEPKPVLLEATCPHCHKAVRGTALGVIGEPSHVEAQCGECGGRFAFRTTGKELDS